MIEIAPPEAAIVREDVRRALAEDIGGGDLTAALIPEHEIVGASLVCRDAAVICGRPWFTEVFAELDARVQIDWHVSDGERLSANSIVCTLTGPARALLMGERTALNFLQTLSGTATAAHAYVDEVRGTGVEILDTRKTIPGLRRAQKYAALCGGARNHRMGLYDGILIKENHIVASGGLIPAIEQARTHAPAGVLVEVEVEDLRQVREALVAGADILLLDNMDLDMLREAVDMTDGKARLEASGGVTLRNVREIAETGVDFISIGAMTKDVKSVDLSLRFDDALV